jgi:RNA polymerase sigma factor (sigma-70 family)
VTTTSDRFEDHRTHLRGVAFRMLGAAGEAEDAVQEAWLRLQRTDTSDVANLRGWLTTVVARVCLDMLRSRTSRREQPLDPAIAELPSPDHDAERELALADSVGLAAIVVLDKLEPAERIAFVLHDLFAVSFDDIAGIVGRSPAAARQLASRARRRVHGAPPPAEVAGQRRMVEAFIAALRGGDVEAMIAVLDPDVVVRVGAGAGAAGPQELRGARKWATGAVAFGGAMRHARVALVDGGIALVLAPHGQTARVMCFEFAADRIVGAEIIAAADELEALEIAELS